MQSIDQAIMEEESRVRFTNCLSFVPVGPNLVRDFVTMPRLMHCMPNGIITVIMGRNCNIYKNIHTYSMGAQMCL